MPDLRPRVTSNICTKCRKVFQPGDRVVMVMIVTKVGKNEQTRDVGAWMAEEFEVGHFVCADPSLIGKLIG